MWLACSCAAGFAGFEMPVKAKGQFFGGSAFAIETEAQVLVRNTEAAGNLADVWIAQPFVFALAFACRRVTHFCDFSTNVYTSQHLKCVLILFL